MFRCGVLLIRTMSRVRVCAQSTGSVYRNTIIIQYFLFAHTMQLSGLGESIEYMSEAIKLNVLSIKLSISRFIAFYMYCIACSRNSEGESFIAVVPIPASAAFKRHEVMSMELPHTAYSVYDTSTGAIAYTRLSHAHVQRHGLCASDWLCVPFKKATNGLVIRR